jgi:hypothetical protein
MEMKMRGLSIAIFAGIHLAVLLFFDVKIATHISHVQAHYPERIGQFYDSKD